MTLHQSEKTELQFIHILKCLAVVLILYDHIVPGSYYMAEIQPPVTIVDEYIIWPLAITNYFGAFGVDIFFLISGFAILHSVQKRENIGMFLLRRIVRILPPLIFGFGLFILFSILLKLCLQINITTTISEYIGINGALWTLKVEICFYLLFAMLLPVFRRNKIYGTFFLLVVTTFVCQTGAAYPSLFKLGQIVSYIFYILAGMVIYLIWSGCCKMGYALILGGSIWFGIIYYNIRIFNPERYHTENSFGVSAMYAILIFLVFLLVEDHLKYHTLIKTVAQYSFGLYLHHMPCHALLFLFLRENMYMLMISTLGLSVLVAYIQVHFIERPSSKFLKMVNRKIQT